MKLRQWYQVHAKLPLQVSPHSLSDAIQPAVPELIAEFDMCLGAWSSGIFRSRSCPLPTLMLRCISASDPDFIWSRNGWEAELRNWPPKNCDLVIEHLRHTCQTFTIKPITTTLSSAKLARICERLCGCIARETDGLIHVYQEGFFSVEGKSIFPFSDKHRLQTT